MIPLPPRDPVLPGVRIALNGASMAALFERSLTHSTVVSCRPYYVRYKPARYCRVQYELRLRAIDRDTTFLTKAHVSLHPSKRARKLAARYRLGSSTPGAAYIAELSAIARVFPVDLALRGLAEAASSDRMADRFRRALPDRPGKALRGCEVDLLRYKAEKRAVLRYRLVGASVDCVYGKLRKDGGRSLLRVSEALNQANVATPATLAWFSDLGMVVQKEAAGVRLGDLRGSREYERWMPDVAEALARLHATPIESLSRYSAKTEAEHLADAATTVGRLVPHLASEADALARRLTPLLAVQDRVSTVHGSFHDDQVLVGEGGVTFVDMDNAMVADPLCDVGHFLSYLSAEPAGRARERFLDAYMATSGRASEDYLVFEAASLLRWATLPFRELRPDWQRSVEHRVRCATERLDSVAITPPAAR
jgi:hypothetical protein